MVIELPLLFLILLAKTQGLRNLFGTPAPAPAVPRTQVPPPDVPSPLATSPAQPQAQTPQAQAARTAPPWPQVVPSDLPPFPSGWSPASPVTGAMVTRAFQLLPELWKFGEGTWKPEQTGDRWVVYRASMTQKPDGSLAKGVVAFTAPSQAPAQSAFRTSPAAPTVTPGPSLLPAQDTVRASSTTAAPNSLPTLRKGSRGPSVVWLQQKLGIPADGNFGSGTQAAVIAFQHSHGLGADGVVGPKTWAALGGSSQAA